VTVRIQVARNESGMVDSARLSMRTFDGGSPPGLTGQQRSGSLDPLVEALARAVERFDAARTSGRNEIEAS
jgi:hypothetical protein